MGWTMGLEPHSSAVSTVRHKHRMKIETDRDHNPGLYPAAARPRYVQLLIGGRSSVEDGVDDGTRTHDDRDHNPGLYQLSYVHHR